MDTGGSNGRGADYQTTTNMAAITAPTAVTTQLSWRPERHLSI